MIRKTHHNSVLTTVLTISMSTATYSQVLSQQGLNAEDRDITAAFSTTSTFDLTVRSQPNSWGPADETHGTTNFRLGANTLFLFRGVKVLGSDAALQVGATHSELGWTVGFDTAFDNDASEYFAEPFGSYSYPLGFVDLSFGISGFFSSNDDVDERVELFLEAVFDPICGIHSSMGHYLNLNGRISNYTQVDFSYPMWPRNDVRISPYVSVGFGDFYSSKWSMNHVQVGIDATITVNHRIELRPYAGLSFPLRAVRDYTGQSDAEFFLGLIVQVKL